MCCKSVCLVVARVLLGACAGSPRRGDLRFVDTETAGSLRHGQLDDALFSHDEGATSAVSFSFPTEYLLEHGPAHLRALCLELGRELPFSSGYASLAFVSHPGVWYAVRKQLLGLLQRYPGLDLCHLMATGEVIGTGARGAS